MRLHTTDEHGQGDEHAPMDVAGTAYLLGVGGDPLEGAEEEDPERHRLEEVTGVVAVQRGQGKAQTPGGYGRGPSRATRVVTARTA